jgi:hypothetical protein
MRTVHARAENAHWDARLPGTSTKQAEGFNVAGCRYVVCRWFYMP